MLKVEIKTGGAAFRDTYSGEENDVAEAMECARLLRKIAKQMEDGAREGSIMDLNGNKVGRWSL